MSLCLQTPTVSEDCRPFAGAIAVLSLLLAGLIGPVHAQPAASPTPQEVVVEGPDATLRGKLDGLEGILAALRGIEQQIRALQDELAGPSGRGREEELTAQIKQLVADQEKLNRDFNEIASEVPFPTAAVDEPDQILDWGHELQELLGPLIREIKAITSKPRALDRLRRRVEALEEQLREAEHAQENLSSLRAQATHGHVVKSLSALERDWQERERLVQTELSIVRQRLNKEVEGTRTFSESLREISKIFFQSRGRNLLLALVLTLTFWLLTRRFYLRLQSSRLFREKQQSFRARVAKIFFLAFSSVGSAFVFLIVLFAFGDWLLLTLAVLVLFGLLWSSKHVLERFWSQAMLLLNAGPVREGEVVTFRDVTWRVGPLNYYTELRNNRFDHKVLRLPLADLADLRSRPGEKKEISFPSEKGDWVLLSDGTVGRVVSQTVDLVSLVLKGGSRKAYQTSAFLGLSPQLLTTGFRHLVVFGLDYQHQAEITEDIPATLCEFISHGLRDAGYDDDTYTVQVELSAAGASSLDLAVIADFSGTLAEHYEPLRRLLNKLCVDAANAHGWVIPFSQLTVHMADRVSK
ncbi:MAG: hypothetical protein KDD69_13085 [Bdellovibrionales bacterium]|nr:hypothetical protein [Bdellovibrionales bacterium]